MPSASGSYGKLAGRRNMAGLQNLKNPLQVNKLFGFLLCLRSAMLLMVLKAQFSLLFSNKAYCRVHFVVCKIWSPFISCQSLLLDTNIPNDKSS